MSTRQLGIHARDAGSVRYLRLSGELDLATIHNLRQALDGCRELASVVVDTTELSFIDSTGLHVLVEARSNLPGFKLIPGEATTRLLTLTGLREFFEFGSVPMDGS